MEENVVVEIKDAVYAVSNLGHNYWIFIVNNLLN